MKPLQKAMILRMSPGSRLLLLLFGDAVVAQLVRAQVCGT